MSKPISHGLYISKIVWEAKGLSKGEALILLAVASRMGTKAEAWPSYSTLADMVKMRRPSTVRLVQKMRQKGLLDYTDDRKSNSYTINIELLLSMVESSRRESLADCVQVVTEGDQPSHRRLAALFVNCGSSCCKNARSPVRTVLLIQVPEQVARWTRISC